MPSVAINIIIINHHKRLLRLCKARIHDHIHHSIEDHLGLNCWQLRQRWCATKGLPVWHFLKRGLSLLLHICHHHHHPTPYLHHHHRHDYQNQYCQGHKKYHCELVKAPFYIKRPQVPFVKGFPVTVWQFNGITEILKCIKIYIVSTSTGVYINGTPSQMSWKRF